MVEGGIAGEWKPPLTPPYQGGESFSSRMVSGRIMQSPRAMTVSFLHRQVRTAAPILPGAVVDPDVLKA